MGLADDFKSAHGYKFDFKREVEAFYADWPHLINTVLFVHVTDTGYSFIGHPDAAELEDEFKDDSDFKNDVKQVRARGSVTIRYGFNTGDVDIVFLNLNDTESSSSLKRIAGQDIENCFTFDHEIAHAICKNGRREVKDILVMSHDPCEDVGDAYATLRHLQRFNKKPETMQALTSLRAAELLLWSNADHFTSPVVQQIVNDRESFDFSKLTPQQVADMASDYAQKSTLPSSTVHGMMEEFLKMGNRRIKDIGEAVVNASMPETFRWGAAGLRAILDGFVKLPNGVEPLSDKDAQKLREKLDKREAELAGTASKPRFGFLKR
jgi:hypothetical protein